MFTRTTTVTAIAAGLLGTITIVPSLSGNASAAPPSDVPPLHAPTTTILGPTTLPENIPVSHDTDESTMSEPVRIDVESATFDEAEAPNEIEVDPDLTIDRKYLNPCKVEPKGDVIELGGVRQLDLDGSGADDDRATLYFDGDWKLRVELSNGIESEVWISPHQHGQRRPEFAREAELDLQPGDEIKLKTIDGTAGTYYEFIGISDEGCAFRYTNKLASFTTAMVRSHDGYQAHVNCYPGGLVQQVIATERSDGWWDVERLNITETGPRQADRVHAGGALVTEANLPTPGWSC